MAKTHETGGRRLKPDERGVRTYDMPGTAVFLVPFVLGARQAGDGDRQLVALGHLWRDPSQRSTILTTTDGYSLKDAKAFRK